jgi:hypothetical protein
MAVRKKVIKRKFILTLCHGLSYMYAYASVVNFFSSRKPKHLGTCFFAGICLGVSCLRCVHEVPKFQIFSKQEVKNLEKIFKKLLQNCKCFRWTKTCFIIPKRSFLKFVRGNFLWPIFFFIMLPRVQRYDKFKSSITFLLLVLERKIVLPGYINSYPRNAKIRSYLTFDLHLKVKPRSICLFWI